MYNELVKRLRYCSKERSGCGMCALSSDCVLRAGLLTQAADAIEYMQKIIPVQPYGRLIDADILMDVIAKNSYPVWQGHDGFEYGMTVHGIQQVVAEAPTIIPAKTILENEIKIIDTKGKPNYDSKHRFIIPTEDSE